MEDKDETSILRFIYAGGVFLRVLELSIAEVILKLLVKFVV